MKKTMYVWAITLVIAGLVITSAAAIVPQNKSASSVRITKLDNQLQKLTIDSYGTKTYQPIAMPLDTNPAFAFAGDQLHPAFGRSANFNHMAAYTDSDTEDIVWTFSADDGATYDAGGTFGTGGDYPSIKLWDGTIFYGTFVPDPDDLDGGPSYLFETTDPTNTGTYALSYWDWSSYGWHDILDNEIACDNSQEAWEWGFTALVASTTYTTPAYIDGPFITYQTSEDGYATISWYLSLPNCDHADAAIDHVTYNTYAAYDRDTGSNYELLLRLDHFDNWDANGGIYEITGAGNLKYPAVAANDGNIVLLAETDENGNKDVACFYGTNPQTLTQSFVADSVDDETYPDVRFVDDTTFIATFISNGMLYKTVTDDAGATWSAPEEIDSCVDEYKSADITDFAGQAMYEKDNGDDIDLWLENDLGGGGGGPIIEVAINSGFGLGVSADVSNTGTEDATDVEWTMTVTGGILGFINKEVTGTISSLPMGESETISSGMIIGLGSISITATADIAEATGSGTQLLIFSIVS